jgi:hypothetical protein
MATTEIEVKPRNGFTTQEVHMVRETYKAAASTPCLDLKMCVDAHPIKMGDKKMGKFFRFASTNYGIELCPEYIKRPGQKQEPACMVVIRNYALQREVESRVISCKSVGIETIFAHAVAAVQFLELLASDADK